MANYTSSHTGATIDSAVTKIAATNSSATELNLLDGVTATTAEINIIDGSTSATSTTLADADRVVVNDNGTMVQVALTDFETYFESALDTLSNVTTVGALNSGSITSGFGSISNGSSAITTTGTITYGSLSDGSITITAFVDEDNMSSNSATLVPTQQSVKAYVDTQITAEDLDISADSGSNIAIDLDSEVLAISGGEGIDTSITGNAVTIAAEEATSSNKGVASFDSTDFSVSSGAVTLQAERIQDIAGAMFSSNTESGITVTYQDGDGTIDLTVGTLNQDTTGNAATATALENARTIHGVSFDGTANIDLTEVVQDTVGAMFSSNTETNITATYQDGDGTIDLVATGDVSLVTSSHDYLSISGQAITLGQIDIGDDTNLAAGTNITLSGDTLNVDDAFLINSGNDTTSGTITAAGFTTTGTLAAGLADIDDVVINGTTIGHTDDTDLITLADGNVTIAGELDLTTLDVSGNADIDGTLEADAYTVAGTALNEYISDTVGAMVSSNTESGITVVYQDADNTLDFTVGTLNQNTTGNAATATLSSTVTITDKSDNVNYDMVFGNSTSALYDDTGALYYNPSTGTLRVPNLNVAGTTTTVDTVTMEAANAIKFEGATADANETILSIVDPTNDDNTQYLLNASGYIPLLAAVTTTTISSTPAELNVLDGYTGSVTELNYAKSLYDTGVTDTEFDYLDGVTSNIQTQLDATGGATSFQLEDGDGTEVTINHSKEIKFVEGAGIDINWTDTSTGSDGDPYDLTFTVDHDAATNFVANEHIDWTASSAGTIHATNYSNTQLSTEQVQDIVGAMFTGNTETRVAATYEDGDGTIDIVVDDMTANTTYTGGTNLSLSGTTFNVDDAFLKNDANDTTSGTITAAGFTTTGNLSLAGHAVNDIDIGSEFVDADDHLMTSGAIKEKIESYGYTTTGAITALNNATANELVTVGSTTTELDAEANLTFDGSTLTINNSTSGVSALDFEDASDLAIFVPAAQTSNYYQPLIGVGENSTTFTAAISSYDAGSSAAQGLAFHTGNTNAITEALKIDSSQDITITAGSLSLPATEKLYLDGGTHTYIYESSDDNLSIFVGGQEMIKFYEGGTDYVHVNDNTRLGVGNSPDFYIYHDATNTHQINTTGDLYIKNSASDEDIYLQVSDGGSTVTAIQVDGSENGKIIISDSLKVPVAKKVFFGGSEHTYIGEDIDDRLRFFTGGAEFMRFTESTDNSFSIYEDVYISDDKKIHLGNGNDIKIYHNAGGNSNIENHSGDLYFTQYTDDGDIFFRSDDGSGGVTNYLQLDGGSKFVMIPSDSIQFTLGASQDLRLYHNGSNTFMKNYTGTMYFEQHTDDGDMIFYCDDGSGGVTEYFRLDGSSGYSIASKLIRYEDSVKAMFGTGGDFAIQHDGSNTYMTNSVTGHLYIQQSVDDKDIVLQSDDGSGGVTAYLTLDGSATQTLLHQDTVLTATKKLILDGVASSGTYIVESSNDVVDIYAGGTNMLRIEESGTDYVQVFDNTRLTVGTGKDLQIYHDGSNTYMVNYVGSLIFEQQLADGNIIFNSDDGSGGAANYMIIDGGSEIITVHKLMRFDDNVDLRLGAGSDLRLYHTGSHSYMTNYLGDLVIRNYTDDGDVKLESDDGSGGTTTYIRLDGSDTSVDIEQDVKLTAAKKLYLDGGGDTYILETSADLVDLYVGTQNALRVLETSNVAYTYVPDSQFLGAGTSIDFTMSHDATNSKLVNNTGDLYIINNDNDKDIIFQTDDDSGGVTNYLQLDGSELRATFNVHTRFNDSKQVQIGSAADLIIYHDASNTWIQHQGTGNLINYVSTQDADWYVKVNDGGVATNAIQVDASNKGTVLLPNDLQYLKFGVGGDGVLYSYNDDFYVSNFTAGKDTIFQNLNSDSSSYVEIMRLDGSTSRVGIGTNSPDELLEVAGTTKISSTGDTTLYIDGAGNGYTSGCIVFQGSDDDASYRGTGVFNHDAASDIEYFSGTLYANDAWAVCRKTSTSSHDTSVAQGSNALFIIEGGGDVGIGLTNPSYKLHVSGDSYFTDQMRIVGSTDVGLVVESTDGSSMIALKDNSTSGDYYNGIGAVGNELFLKSNNAERVRIDSSGNVGIGTTSPGAKLEVNGTGEFRDILYIAHGGSDYAPNISFLGGSDVAGSNAYENAGIGYYDNSGTGTMLFFGNRAAMNWTWKDDGDTLFHMASGGTFHANADVVAYSSTTSSDKRLKENINPIPYGLEEVLKMNPVEYDWKEKRNKAHDIGVIAQELEKIIPEVVQENKDLNSDKMIKGVDYGKMVAVLIKAIQEQQEEIELLKANYDDLKYNRR